MKTPKLSIILPNYNYARYLPQRIESILNQLFTDFELIILDDASSDNSIVIIEKYKRKYNRIKTIYSKRNSGSPFIQWDKGIDIAKGEYIWIAEADDWAKPDFINKLIPAFENHNTIISFCQSNKINAKGISTGIWEYSNAENKKLFVADTLFEGNNLIEKALIHENVLPNASAVIFRKSAYYEVGGVNTQLKTNADWLLWLKLATMGKFAYTNQALNYFRRHEKSVIAKIPEKSKTYQEQFDKTMRLNYQKFLNRNFGNEFRSIKLINKQYINFDRGNEALDYLNNKSYCKGFKELFHATIELKSLGFIKKVVKKCLV